MLRLALLLGVLAQVAIASEDRFLEAEAGSAANGSCQIEDNVDYIGNDLSNEYGASAEDCCAKCHDTYGCTAFTWSDYQGGKCWFKTAKGETKVNPGVRSAQVTPGNNPNPDASDSGSGSGSNGTIEVCHIRNNVDFIGNDIGHFHARKAEMCCDLCQQTAGCGAFSWTDYQGGECWLKGFKGETKKSKGVRSAVVVPLSKPPQSACTLDVGVNYVGNDLHSLADGYGVWDCCNECAKVPGCKAYTWTNDNGGTCWFKSAKNLTSVQSGASSGVLSGHVTQSPCDDEPWNDQDLDLSLSIAKPDKHHKDHIQYKIRAGKIPVRAANLGGWFVGEYWMTFTSPMWDNAWGLEQSGEYVVMKALGHKRGDKQFDKHRRSWIKEKDIKEIAAAGINTVRVPVGFWIVDDDPSANSTEISRTFAPGGLKYLDRLINVWAAKHNVAVMLSLHAHQGSQNGNDHSAPLVKGQATWGESEANFNSSVQFATVLAHRYKDSPAFLGMGLMNEPTEPAYDVLLAYYEEAYKRIRKDGNDCILTVAPHLGDQGSSALSDFMLAPNYTNVWVEWHVYFKWGYEGQEEDAVIAAAKRYADTYNSWTGNPVFMGEWSLGTAEAAPFKNQTLLKQFAQNQLDALHRAKGGWSFWAWKNDQELYSLSGWSFRQLIKKGIVNVPNDGGDQHHWW